MVSLLSPASKLLIGLIGGYQFVISPLLGPHCRFRPTCSQYAIEAIRRFSILTGSWLTLKRVLKCHPLNPGGEDPVPPKHLSTENTNNGFATQSSCHCFAVRVFHDLAGLADGPYSKAYRSDHATECKHLSDRAGQPGPES